MIPALITIVALVGLVWWLAAWARNGEKLIRMGRTLHEQLREAAATSNRALQSKQDEAKRLKSALSTVERQRNAAIENLATMGDPDGIAAGIRNELERVQALSTDPAPEDR